VDPDGDYALLRRFEPVLRFTQGERFYPMDCAAYAKACSLWVQPQGTAPRQLEPRGALTLECLAALPLQAADEVYYLRLVDKSDENQHWLPTREDRTFRAGSGRLARVGYTSRLVDALFKLSLLARGRMPRAAARAAVVLYAAMMAERDHFCYHGRVLRQGEWTVLQYWFFYAYDDWRSGYHGANDHEADWELVCAYGAATPDDGIVPEWVAYASHNDSGPDLRRRWDDPELDKLGEHPVVYVGAGSHSSYFKRGEYLPEIALPVWPPLACVARNVQRFWHGTLRQGADLGHSADGDGSSRVFTVAFVDYARGDGLVIGPGQEREWDSPRLLDSTAAWVDHYHGRFGMYARDPFAAEDAPAGPMFTLDGAVRRAWYDPVGWAGLEKVATSANALPTLWQQVLALQDRQESLRSSITALRQSMLKLGVEEAALHQVNNTHRSNGREPGRELDRLQEELAESQLALVALNDYGKQLLSGQRSPAQAHLQRPHEPTSPVDLRLGRVADVWAALSIGLLLVGWVALRVFLPAYSLSGLIPVFAFIVFLEAYFRGWLSQLVVVAAVLLAVASTVVLMVQFFTVVIIVAVLGAGLFILWQNLRELWA
jgi:hypothetical protein